METRQQAAKRIADAYLRSHLRKAMRRQADFPSPVLPELGQAEDQDDEEAYALIDSKEAYAEGRKLIKGSIWLELKRNFGVRLMDYFALYRELRGIQLGRPVPDDLDQRYRKAVQQFNRVKARVDNKKVSPPVLSALMESEPLVRRRLQKVMSVYRNDPSKRGGAQTWKHIIRVMSEMISMLARDKRVYLQAKREPGGGVAAWTEFRAFSSKKELLQARLEDEDPAAAKDIQRLNQTLEQMDRNTKNAIHRDGRLVRSRNIMGSVVKIGITRETKSLFDEAQRTSSKLGTLLSKATSRWQSWWRELSRIEDPEERAQWLKDHPEPRFAPRVNFEARMRAWQNEGNSISKDDLDAYEDWKSRKPRPGLSDQQIAEVRSEIESLQNSLVQQQKLYDRYADEFVYTRNGERMTVDEYAEQLREEREAMQALSGSLTLDDKRLAEIRVVPQEILDNLDSPIESLALTDDDAKKHRLTKIFQVQEIPVAWVPELGKWDREGTRDTVKVVISGRYAGCPVDSLVAAHGRLIEGTEWTFEQREGSLRGRPKRDKSGHTIASREPFVTKAQDGTDRLYLTVGGDKEFREIVDRLKRISYDPDRPRGQKVVVPPPEFEPDMIPYQDKKPRVEGKRANEVAARFNPLERHLNWLAEELKDKLPEGATPENILSLFKRKAPKALQERFAGILADDLAALVRGVRQVRRGQYGFYFTPENFGLVKETIGTMALSKAAGERLRDYFDDLTRAEEATKSENLAPYSTQQLGDFNTWSLNDEGQAWKKERDQLSWRAGADPDNPEAESWRARAKELSDKLRVGPQLLKELQELRIQIKWDADNPNVAEWERRIEEIKHLLKTGDLGGFEFQLLELQKKALAWLDANDGKGVCALDTGIGKTLVAAAMCQKYVRDGWTEETESLIPFETEYDGKVRRQEDLEDQIHDLKRSAKNDSARIPFGKFSIWATDPDTGVSGEQPWPYKGADDKGKTKTVSKEEMQIALSAMEKELEDLNLEVDALGSQLSDMKEKASTNGRFLYVVPTKGLRGNLDDECKKWMTKAGYENLAPRIDAISAKAFQAARNKPMSTAELAKKTFTHEGKRYKFPDLPPEVQRQKMRSQQSVVVKRGGPKGGDVRIMNWRQEVRNYITIFFDEAHEYINKTTGATGEAFLGLEHPRKVVLTASPMTTEPMDAYVLQAVCNNIDLSATKTPEGRKNRKDMLRFKERFCETIGGRVLGAKDDPIVKRDLHTWVRSSIFFADKTDVKGRGEVPKMHACDGGGTQVEMQSEVEDRYKQVASSVIDRLQALEERFTLLNDVREVVTDPETGETKTVMVKKRNPTNPLTRDPSLEDFSAMTIRPFFQLLTQLAVAPELARLPKIHANLENPKVKNPEMAAAYRKAYRELKSLYDTAFPGVKPGDLIFPDLTTADNPKYQKANRIVREKNLNLGDAAKTILWSEDEKVCLAMGKQLSKDFSGSLHAVALKDTIHLFRDGQEETSYLYPKEVGGQKGKPGFADDGGDAWELPFRERSYRMLAGRPRDDKKNPGEKNFKWTQFVTKRFIQGDPRIRTMVCHGPSYQSGQNFQAFQTVIHLDRDTWNNENMKQRTARAWRQGQRNEVEEYTLDASYVEPRNPKDKTLDQIRLLHQRMEGSIFDGIIKQAQSASMGDEWSEIQQRYSNYMKVDEKIMRMMVSPTQSGRDGWEED